MIEVTLKTGKRKKPRKIIKSVYVYSNDPDNKKIKLKIIANITGDKTEISTKPEKK